MLESFPPAATTPPTAEPSAVASTSETGYAPPKGFETRFRDLPLHLPHFEGPLDLLLHLIREQKLDILDFPVASVTRQYMDYLLLMEELNLEIAAEFIAMAAHLLQIKSRMLLPRPPAADDPETDPRGDLVQKLLDYQQVKEAAALLSDQAAQWGGVIYARGLDLAEHARVEDEPIKVTLFDLLAAYREALRALLPPPPVEVRTPPKTLDQRIAEVMNGLQSGEWRQLGGLLGPCGTKEDLVLTFLALLELMRTGRICLIQTEAFGEIRVKAA